MLVESENRAMNNSAGAGQESASTATAAMIPAELAASTRVDRTQIVAMPCLALVGSAAHYSRCRSLLSPAASEGHQNVQPAAL